ncbi:MAG: 5'-nucleotidase [Myxococcota bacterium]
MTSRTTILLAVLGLCCGCGGWLTAYNECNADPGERLGRTTVDLDVRKVTVRSGEAPIGNLVVDAMYEAAAANCIAGSADRPCPVAAVENAGGIRATTSCGERESIPVGPIHQADVTDLLPFATNQIVVVEVTGEELWLMLERAVSLLGQVGEAGAAGYFLQVRNISFEIDCDQAPQTLSLSGDQILRRGSRVDPARVTVGGATLDLAATYPIAMNSFVAGARDGFLALAERNPDDSVVLVDGKMKTKEKKYVLVDGNRVSEGDVLARHVRNKETVAPIVEGRIRVLPSCTPD